jgi:small subunit ribosomal protein S2
MSTANNRTFLQSLVKSGIYWGHRKSRRNPKMEPYIWGQKNNVNLIDVSKTARQLEKAANFLEQEAAAGKMILWVGTKKPAQEAVFGAATRLKMPSVTHRWIGGTLSNYAQVKKSVTKLLHLEDVISKADRQIYTKKELNVLQKNIERLQKNVGGIKNLSWPVAAIVIIDIIKEHSALKEAAALGIPIVALVDTNADPSLVNYVIPGNDDAPRAVKLVIDYLADAVAKGLETAAAKPVEGAETQASEGVDLSLIEATSEEDDSSRHRRKAEGASKIKPPARKREHEGSRSRTPRKTMAKED